MLKDTKASVGYLVMMDVEERVRLTWLRTAIWAHPSITLMTRLKAFKAGIALAKKKMGAIQRPEARWKGHDNVSRRVSILIGF